MTTPSAIVAHPLFHNAVVPAHWWNNEVLEREGIARMREVIQDVIDVYDALGD
jgi:hypothetical protein